VATQHLALSARGVEMRYRDRQSGESLLALEKVDLDVPDGAFVSLLGPSGCGKSTFLKIVNGLITQTAGEIKLHRVAKGREDAMVFQDAALFPWYSVLDNVAYGLVCAGVPRADARRRAAPFIDLVGLKGFGEKYPYQLSGGMQQRANLARALAVDAAILLMDEPFASLDAQTREMMQAELLRIWNAAQKTVLFVTHQIDEAVYLSDRVVVMAARPGRLIADIAIDIPRPRALSVKRTPEFARYEEEIWRLIAGQHERAPADVATRATA
jgi:NitT/TauT family transport system ATP-binding protein